MVLAKLIVDKLQAQMTAVILNRRDILEHLMKTLPKEPVVGILLDLDQVRHFENFFLTRIAHPHAFADLYGINSVFNH